MGQCYVFLFFAACLSMQIQPLLSRRPGNRWSLHFGSEDASCDLPAINKGRTRWLRRPIAKVYCLPSYKLFGTKYITCKDGEWEETLPVCARAGCQIPLVPNSYVIPRDQRNALIEYYCMPEHKMVGRPVISCDGSQWNASAPSCVSVSTPPVLTCDFDKDMCGWEQDDDGEFDWTRTNMKTPSSSYQTGPSTDHTTGSGFYMYIESTGRNENSTARLISQVYDDKLSRDGCFSFFYHMYGRYTGGLRVYQRPMSVALGDLKDDELLFEKWYNQGDQWLENVSKLNNISENFQIVIEGIRGESFTSDIAIDDVALLQGENCSAVATTPHLPPTTPQPLESCMDRCNQVPEPNSSDCSCSWDCFSEGTCCQDIIYICFDKLTMMTVGGSEDNTATARSLPHGMLTTEPRSVARAGTVAMPSTTTSTTTKSTTTKSTTTIKTTTNYRPTSTTPKPTSTQSIAITHPKMNTTTASGIRHPTKAKGSTTVKPTTAATHKTTAAKRAFVPRVIQNDSSRARDTAKPQRVTVTKSSTSGKATAITFAVLLCCLAVACATIAARTARGRETIARLRGRRTSSTEVRYLTADTDD